MLWESTQAVLVNCVLLSKEQYMICLKIPSDWALRRSRTYSHHDWYSVQTNVAKPFVSLSRVRKSMTALRPVCGRTENACMFLESRKSTDYKRRRCAFGKLREILLRRHICLPEVACNVAGGGCREEAVHTGVSKACHKTTATGVLPAFFYLWTVQKISWNIIGLCNVEMRYTVCDNVSQLLVCVLELACPCSVQMFGEFRTKLFQV